MSTVDSAHQVLNNTFDEAFHICNINSSPEYNCNIPTFPDLAQYIIGYSETSSTAFLLLCFVAMVIENYLVEVESLLPPQLPTRDTPVSGLDSPPIPVDENAASAPSSFPTNSVRDALALALHPRVGAMSPLAALDQAVFELLLDELSVPPPLPPNVPVSVLVRVCGPPPPPTATATSKPAPLRVVVAAGTSVAALKRLISAQAGVAAWRQRLVMGGRCLRDGESVGATGGPGFCGPSGERAVLLWPLRPRRRRRAPPSGAPAETQ
jgi:hypothetical protein